MSAKLHKPQVTTTICLSHLSVYRTSCLPLPKKRKLSDLTVGDATELLHKLEEFRSNLDEGDEDLPAGLIENCVTNWKKQGGEG
jgi:hypothetical protein